MHFLFILIIGAIAGWLGSLLLRSNGYGLIGNMVIGILGSFVGYWLLGKIGLSFGGGILGAILTGAVGAIVILVILQIISGKK